MASPSLVFLLLLLPAVAMAATGHNTTHILSKFSDFSSFNRYLIETKVVQEIDSRSSVTVMVPTNAALDAYIQSIGGPNQLLYIADVLRYHCILQYLDMPEIRTMAESNATGITLPTLYQTTGRASGTSGFIKVSVSQKTKAIHLGVPDLPAANFNATVVTNVTQFPYTVSYMQVDHVVAPAGLQNSQAAAAGVQAALAELKKKTTFSTALALLEDTGVRKALEAMSAVTLLVPTDAAFSSASSSLGGLSQAEKISLIQYHCIPTYFTFGSLQSVTTPLPTVASSSSGKFDLNVTSGKDSVTFTTGINSADVQYTVVDNPPVSCYAIDKVLLPPEIFAVSPVAAPGPSPFPSPALAPSPELSPTPPPQMSPSPSPELSPSPSPELAPAPAPELSPAPTPAAASPPAPPLSPDTSISAPDSSAPTSPTKNGAPSVRHCSSLVSFMAATAAAAAMAVAL